MKKALLIVLVLLLSISLFGCVNAENQESQQETPRQADSFDEKAAASLAEEFGSKLQAVSLQAAKEELEKSMKENYADFVSEELLSKWVSDPQNAPGRLTSSPWPDRIDVQTVVKLEEAAYEVKGEIIEITSVEKTSGGIAAKRPVTLVIKKTDDKWLIDEATLGAYEENSPLTYVNTLYGFEIALTGSWKDYKVIT